MRNKHPKDYSGGKREASCAPDGETVAPASHERSEGEPSPAEIAAANPLQFFSLEDCGAIFGFGRDVMTAIAKAIAKDPAAPPIIARKVNPRMLLAWLEKHGHEVGKIRS